MKDLKKKAVMNTLLSLGVIAALCVYAAITPWLMLNVSQWFGLLYSPIVIFMVCMIYDGELQELKKNQKK